MDSQTKEKESLKNIENQKQNIPANKFAFKINKEIWRYKLHYFLFVGALGAGLAYVPVIATRRIGISTTAFAMVLMVQQFLFIFTKPAIGYLADYFNKLKVIICSLIFIQTICYAFILFIPKINQPLKNSGHILISNLSLCMFHNSQADATFFENFIDSNISNRTQAFNLHDSDFQINVFIEYHPLKNCGKSNNSINKELLTLKQNLVSEYSYCWELHDISNIRLNCASQLFNKTNLYDYSYNLDYNDCLCLSFDKSENSRHNLSRSYSSNCVCCSENNCCAILQFECENPPNNSSNDAYQTELLTYQFWLFTILCTSGMVCTNATFTLSDTACCESVEKAGAQFGRQRMWGSVGWGLFAPLAGQLNDYTGDYISSWCVMIACLLLTAWNISKVELAKPHFSQNILKDIRTVLKSGEFLVFEMGLLMNGIGAAIVWNYLILFLTSIGGSKLLFGLALAVQSFFGAIPLMFFAGKIIDKMGHMNVLSLALLTYMLRFMWYSYLKNPWWTLLVEAFHGLTYGLLYANIASFGKATAKPGTEATTQSLLFTMHEGLGCGLGCVLGGIGLDQLGGHMTFFIASLFAGCGLILHQFLYLFVRRSKGVMKVTTTP